MTLPPIAILAGGLATRLRPITETVPKAMVPVNGEPFCALQLRQLAAQGFDRAVFLVGAMGDQIRSFVGDGARFGIHVDYVDDGPCLLGTGGAVKQALPLLGEQFFVTYGDTFLRYDPSQIIARLGCESDAVMVVLRNRNRWDRSNVSVSGGSVIRYSKTDPDRNGMEWIDYGATLFRAEAFLLMTGRDGFDLAELMTLNVARRRVAAFEVTDRFYEIGTAPALAEAEAWFAQAAIGPSI